MYLLLVHYYTYMYARRALCAEAQDRTGELELFSLTLFQPSYGIYRNHTGIGKPLQ